MFLGGRRDSDPLVRRYRIHVSPSARNVHESCPEVPATSGQVRLAAPRDRERLKLARAVVRRAIRNHGRPAATHIRRRGLQRGCQGAGRERAVRPVDVVRGPPSCPGLRQRLAPFVRRAGDDLPPRSSERHAGLATCLERRPHSSHRRRIGHVRGCGAPHALVVASMLPAGQWVAVAPPTMIMAHTEGLSLGRPAAARCGADHRYRPRRRFVRRCRAIG